MQRAVERLEIAAIRLANTTAVPERPVYVPPIPREGIGSGIAAIQGQEALETAMVDIMIAKRAYEANAKAFRPVIVIQIVDKERVCIATSGVINKDGDCGSKDGPLTQ